MEILHSAYPNRHIHCCAPSRMYEISYQQKYKNIHKENINNKDFASNLNESTEEKFAHQ